MKTLIYTLVFVSTSIVARAQIITTVVGTGIGGFNGDNGPAINAWLYYPRGLMFDQLGNYYFSDLLNYRIKKVSSADTIMTVVGTGNNTYNGDNIPAVTANISAVNAVADNYGNLYISDQGSHRIRKVDTAGIITTFAGNGTVGYSGDAGPANQAQLTAPGLVMINRSGEIVFTDFSGNTIRRVDLNGIITTLAGTGTGGFSGDSGLATAAQLKGPYAIAQDTAGNYYVSDQLNNRIRKINKSGMITTIAGNGVQGYGGDNGPALSAALNNPAQLILDDTGNVFFADYYNHRVRKIDLNGIITTVAGTGVQGYSGDNGPAVLAQLKAPWGIAFNKTGDLYIADEGNNVIRKVTNVGVMSVKKQHREQPCLTVSPSPSNGIFTVSFDSNEIKNSRLRISNTLGEVMYESIALSQVKMNLI